MDLFELEKELQGANDDLTALGREIKASAKREAETLSKYEELKNRYLIQLYAEEVELKIKRTVDQRTAMYRTMYLDERRDWLLAKADHESNRDLFRGVQTKITSLQTLIGIEREKMRLS